MGVSGIKIAPTAAEYLVPLLLRKFVQMNETCRRYLILEREQYRIFGAGAAGDALSITANSQNDFHFVIQFIWQPIEIIQM